MRHPLILVTLAISLISLTPCLGQDAEMMASQLRSELLGDYDNRVPPQGGVVVKIQLALYQIVEFSTPKQSLKFQGWWRHTWYDARLPWDPEDWGGISSLVLPFDVLWKPDDLIYEITDLDDLGVPVFTLYSSGLVFYSFPKLATVGCLLDLKNFPFDTQVCQFTVGSMSYDGSFVDIVPYDVAPDDWFDMVEEDGKQIIARQNKTAIDLSEFQGNTEFALTRIRITSRNNYYKCCAEPYPVLIFELELQRQKLTYLSGIVIPLLGIAFVGYMALFLPAPFSGARPGFSISVMFTTSAIYLAVTRKLPDIGVHTSIGRLYLAAQFSNLIMTFVSVLVTSINVIMNEMKAGRADLINQFRFFDKDRSGKLDTHETRTALRHLGLTPKQADIIILEYDLHPDETISVEEWIELAGMAKKFRPLIQHNFVIGSILEYMMGMKHNFTKNRDGSDPEQESLKQQAVLMNGMNGQRSNGNNGSPSTVTPEGISIGLEYHNFNGQTPGHFGQGVPMQNFQHMAPSPMMAPGMEPPAYGAPHAQNGYLAPQPHRVQVSGQSFGNYPQEGGSSVQLANGSQTHPWGGESGPLLGHGQLANGTQGPLVNGWIGEPGHVMSNGNPNGMPGPGPNTWVTEPVNVVQDLLTQIDAPSEAFEAFITEKIDLETLSCLNKEELAHLGIPTLGQQTRLLNMAKDKCDEIFPNHASRKRREMERDRADALKLMADNHSRKKKSGPNSGSKPRRSSIASATPVYDDPLVEQLHQDAYRNRNMKMLGPLIDYWAAIIVPLSFGLFLIAEYAGVITGQHVTWIDIPPNEVKTLIELQDERALPGGQCFGNVQTIVQLAEGVCASKLAGSVFLIG